MKLWRKGYTKIRISKAKQEPNYGETTAKIANFLARFGSPDIKCHPNSMKFDITTSNYRFC